MKKEIGGFFELEIQKRIPYFNDAITLNCGRSALRYIIRAFNIKKLHLPYYTCWSVIDTVKEEKVEIEFYNIDYNFMPTKEFNDSDFIIYTNYFGVCGDNVEKLSKKYRNLIVDNAQAFFSPLNFGIASFNSARKFFGVSDGAYLKSQKKLEQKFEKDISYKRALYLLKRLDVGANEAYNNFQMSEATFELNKKIKTMSNLTSNILENIDYQYVKNKRLENFKIYHNKLKAKNELKIKPAAFDVPMVYPYMTKKEGLREKLIQNKIYVAKYWQPIDDNMTESLFQKYIIPLPLDQRYDKKDISLIIDLLD